MKISVYSKDNFLEDFIVDIEKYSRNNPYKFIYKDYLLFNVFQEDKKNILLAENSSLIFNNNKCKEVVLTEWDKIFYESLSFLFTEFSLDLFFPDNTLDTPFFEDTSFSQGVSSNIPKEIAFSIDFFEEKKEVEEKKEIVERVYSFDDNNQKNNSFSVVSPEKKDNITDLNELEKKEIVEKVYSFDDKNQKDDSLSVLSSEKKDNNTDLNESEKKEIESFFPEFFTDQSNPNDLQKNTSDLDEVKVESVENKEEVFSFQKKESEEEIPNIDQYQNSLNFNDLEKNNKEENFSFENKVPELDVPTFNQDKIYENNKEKSNFNEFELKSTTSDIFSIQNPEEKTSAVNNSFENVKSSTRVDNFFSLYRLKIFGEYAPFDYFVLSKDKISIGRNPICDIVLNDPEVSRKHLELYKTYEGYVVLDLSEGNAILFEGKYTNKVLLSSGVEFSIGSTTFKLEVKSSFLKEEESSLMPLLSDEDIQPIENKKDNKKKFPPVRIALIALVFIFIAQRFMPKKNKNIVEKSTPSEKVQNNDSSKKVTKEEEEFLSANYELAKHYLKEKMLSEAKEKIDSIKSINPTYKKIQSMEIVINDSLRKIQELELKKKLEEEAELIKQTISILAERLKESLNNKDYISVDILVQEILTKDPENLLALEAKDIVANFREEERLKIEKEERLEKEKNFLLEQIAPGKNYMVQGNYYKAILFFENFLLKPISIEDIRIELTTLLDESKEKLYAITMPLIQEGDLAFENRQFKKAYQVYQKILDKDPSLVDIIIKLDQLKVLIDDRIQDRYQKAILSESYGYLEESKQYFAEILDTTPENHVFYKKSEQKLLSYINN